MRPGIDSFLPIEEPFECLNEIITDDFILFRVRILSTTAQCPFCHKRSHSRHSEYTRKIKDVPFGSRAVGFEVFSHKWFCTNSDCHAKVFTERLSWVSPHHQMTTRLEQVLLKLSIEMNCLAAERACRTMHISVSHDTLLRMLKQLEPEPAGPSPFCRY
jgi:transposase